MKEERAIMDAKVERLQAKMEQQREEAEALRRALETEMASNMQSEQALAALQLRIQALHASKLLTDEELYSLEDAIVDSIEESGAAAGPLAKMIAISEKVADHAMFARQLRRKFV